MVNFSGRALIEFFIFGCQRKKDLFEDRDLFTRWDRSCSRNLNDFISVLELIYTLCMRQ